MIGGVTGVTSTVRSPSAIALQRGAEVGRAVSPAGWSRQAEISRTPRRVETKKPTKRKSATTPPSTTMIATRLRAAEYLSMRATSSASRRGAAACSSLSTAARRRRRGRPRRRRPCRSRSGRRRARRPRWSRRTRPAARRARLRARRRRSRRTPSPNPPVIAAPVERSAPCAPASAIRSSIAPRRTRSPAGPRSRPVQSASAGSFVISASIT